MTALSRTSGAANRRNCRAETLTRDGHRCLICGVTEALTIHHIRPRRIGGTNWHANLATICEPCHTSINDRATTWAAWIEWSYGNLLLWKSRQVKKLSLDMVFRVIGLSSNIKEV